MTKPSNKEILERYANLPNDLKDAIFSNVTTENINAVGKNHGLTIDKIGELAEETGFVMLGLTPPSDYIKNLAGRVGANPEQVRAIAEEINQKVFQPVRESLKKIHGLEPKKEEGVEKGQTVPEKDSGPSSSATPKSLRTQDITTLSTLKTMPRRDSLPTPPPSASQAILKPKPTQTIASPSDMAALKQSDFGPVGIATPKSDVKENLPHGEKPAPKIPTLPIIPPLFAKKIPTIDAPKIVPRTQAEVLKNEIENIFNQPENEIRKSDPYREIIGGE